MYRITLCNPLQVPFCSILIPLVVKNYAMYHMYHVSSVLGVSYVSLVVLNDLNGT